ncbi:Uncharacterized protein QTN25_001510 [Entamoeba marina]
MCKPLFDTQLPDIVQFDKCTHSLQLDPHANQDVDDTHGFVATSLPIVIRKVQSPLEQPNTRVFPLQQKVDGIPYWITRTNIDKDASLITGRVLNMLTTVFIEKKPYFICKTSSNSMSLLQYNKNTYELDEVKITGEIRIIKSLGLDLWKTPTDESEPPHVVAVCSDNEVNIYSIINYHFVLLTKYHSTKNIEYMELTHSGNVFLIIYVKDEIILLNLVDFTTESFNLNFQGNDTADVSFTLSLFPIIYVAKGKKLYSLDVLNANFQVLYIFEETILSIQTNYNFPFYLYVLLDTSVILFDTRLTIGLQSYLHGIPKERLMKDIRSFIMDDKIVVMIASREYVIYIPFYYNSNNKTIDKYGIGSIANLAITLPNKKQRKYHILGFICLTKPMKNNILLIMLDSDYRMTIQEFTFMEYTNNIQKIPSIISPLVDDVQKQIPEVRREINVNNFIQQTLVKFEAREKKK